MSNYHVQTISSNGRSARVIFHVPVNAGNNDAVPPMSWQDAVAEYIRPQDPETGTFGTWVSQLQGIQAGELGDLQSGALLEIVDNVGFAAADTDVEKRNKMDVRFAEITIEQIQELSAKLKFWGFARDIP